MDLKVPIKNEKSPKNFLLLLVQSAAPFLPLVYKFVVGLCLTSLVEEHTSI